MQAINSKPILFSYIRFSMVKQIDGHSLSRQTNAAQEYADKNGFVFSSSSFSDLGVSGWKSKKRSGMEAMLEAIKLGEVKSGDMIFIESFDRLTRRGINHSIQLVNDIVATGVMLHIADDNLTLDKSSLNDLVSIVRVAVSSDQARKESDKKSERLLATKGENRRLAIEENKPTNRKLPFWLSWNKADENYYINEHVAIVKRIIDLRLKGNSDRRISQTLNDEGITTVRGRVWFETSVKKIYSHPAVYGAYQTMRTVRDDPNDHTTGRIVNDTLVKNHYPPIVSYDVYQTLNPPKAKRGSQSNHNHLKRLVKCSRCGQALGKRVTKLKSGTYINYYCLGTQLGTRSCDLPNIKNLHLIIMRASAHLKRKKSNATNDNKALLASKKIKLAQISEAILSQENITALIPISQTLEAEIKDLEAQQSPDLNDELYEKLSEATGAIEWNQLAVKLIDNITLECVIETRQNGSGKTYGEWNIKINQYNGQYIDLVLKGADVNKYEDIKLYKYDYIEDEEQVDIEDYDTAFEMPNDYSGLKIVGLFEI